MPDLSGDAFGPLPFNRSELDVIYDEVARWSLDRDLDQKLAEHILGPVAAARLAVTPVIEELPHIN